MKKVLIVTVAVLLAAGGAMAASDIANTKHNFSNSGTPNPGDWANNEICAPCHVPHGGDQSVAPLWAHDLTSASQSYQVYSSTTMNVTPDNTLGSTHAGTRLCLSCHDDTVALASFTGATSTNTDTIATLYPNSNAVLGTDLRNDHPVMFTYQDSIDDGDAELEAVSGGNMRLWGASSTEVECLSCHDPHGEDGVDYLLWKDNTGSAICLDCHIK
jgi:predicted CXXCH cytochrome family protein